MSKCCKITDCEGKYYALGLCQKHYRRQYDTGTTDHPLETYWKTAVTNSGIVSIKCGHEVICHFNEEDLPTVRKYRWRAVWSPTAKTYYMRTSLPRRDRTKFGGRKTISMHRLLLGDLFPCIDHWDHDGANNRRGNIRCCTKSENGHNMRKGWGKSRYRGVYRNGKHWGVKIAFKGVQWFMGNYADEEDAGLAYDVAAKILYGKYAYSNKM